MEDGRWKMEDGGWRMEGSGGILVETLASGYVNNSLWTTLLTSSSLYLKPPLDFEGEAEIILINIMGKRLLNTTIAGETEIAVSLSSGAYILQLLTKDAQNISKHLIH